MNYKNPLPSPYNYEKLGAYLHALVDAGAARNITEARKLARTQRHTLAAINAAGGTAYVVTSVDDVRRVFDPQQNEKEW